MIREQLNQLIEDISSVQDADELFQAKKEYQSLSGPIFEDDKSYEARMGSFLEWFTFDRPLSGGDLTPGQQYLLEKKDTLPVGIIELCEGLSKSIHSLFTIKKINPKTVMVSDLFENIQYDVHEDQGKVLFNRDDILEGRLVFYSSKFYFSENFCYHPKLAASYIKDRVKKICSIEQGNFKKFKIMQKNILHLEKSLKKTQVAISKLESKRDKTSKEKKKAEIQENVNKEKEQESQLAKEIQQAKDALEDWETNTLQIAHKANRVEFLRNLSYMSLKWERSRQIDIKDIYRD